jgi:hypothetical protein
VCCVSCAVWLMAGETPYTVSLFTFDDLVDTVRPGDRLEVTGIFRALPRRLNSHMTTMRSIYKTYVDAVHFKWVLFCSVLLCCAVLCWVTLCSAFNECLC